MLKTSSKVLPVITLLPSPSAALKFLFPAVPTTRDRLVLSPGLCGKSKTERFAVCGVQSAGEVGATATFRFQVCVSETCCQNRHQKMGRETWFGQVRHVRQALGDRNPNQGRGRLHRKNCPGHKTQRSRAQKRQATVESPFLPAAQFLPITHFPESLLIFSSSETAPGWFNAEALCLAFKTPGKPLLLPLGYALH